MTSITEVLKTVAGWVWELLVWIYKLSVKGVKALIEWQKKQYEEWDKEAEKDKVKVSIPKTKVKAKTKYNNVWIEGHYEIRDEKSIWIDGHWEQRKVG